MSRPRVRWSALAICWAAGVTAGAGGVPTAAHAATGAVAVVATGGSRLAEEIRRELALAAFTVVMVPRRPTPEDLANGARQAMGADWPFAVVVRADEREVVVVSRSPKAPGMQSRFELRLESDDHPIRRRVCLTVVELLRVMGLAGEPRPAGPGGSGQAPAVLIPEGRGVVPPATASTTPTTAPMATPGPATTPTTPSTAPPTARSTTTPAARHADTAAIPATTGGANTAGSPAFDDCFALALSPTMGVATTVDVFSAGSRPSGHVHFLWYLPLGPRASLHVRARWPVVSLGFQSGDTDVRMWTFGAALGLQHSFREASARWRPLVGLIIGNRMLLTDASAPSPTENRSSVTPSVTAGILAGVRHTVGRRAQLLWEIEAARGWMVASANRATYETAAANAFSIHASLGVLFEY
ncbi:MAG: hypothetical protein ABUS79_06290 [Pseudomonadota bacterium]